VTAIELGEELQSLKKETLLLRVPVATSATAYLQCADGTAFYAYRQLRVLQLRKPEPIKITGLSGTPYEVDVRVKSARLHSVSLSLFPPRGAQLDLVLVRRMIADAIVIGDGSTGYPSIICNRVSKVAHARTCNHLPDSLSREPFDSLVDAERAGYHPCPLCFRRIPAIPDLATELALGRMMAGEVTQGARVETGGGDVQRVRDAGGRVLSNWPFPLRGYEYAFDVIDDPTPNAYACPAGRIFVNSGLLAVVESEAELEAVLAHEITHVERRHGYQQLQQALAGQSAIALIGAIAGGAAAASGNSPQASLAAQGSAMMLASVAFSIAIVGHSRGNEEEADSYALVYAFNQDGKEGTEAVRSIMTKLQYFSNLAGPSRDGASAFATHPAINDRVKKASGASVMLFPPGSRWGGFDKSGNLTVVLTLDALARFEYFVAPEAGSFLPPRPTNETRVFCTVESEADPGSTQTIRSMTVTAGGRDYLLDNMEDTRIASDDIAGASFVLHDSPTRLTTEVNTLRCDVPGVTSWRRLSDAE
jgi:hypothetical protein